MKTIFRFLMLGILMTVFSVAAVTPSYAQNPTEKIEMYKKYLDNYDKPEIAKTKIALETGKLYVEKYGADEKDPEQLAFIKGDIPRLEEIIKKTETDVKNKAIYARFNTATDAQNVADLYASGKDVISIDPALELDVDIVLATAGFDEIVKNQTSNTYNADAINYAKAAIQKIEANTPSKTKFYGSKSYSYTTDKFTDGKSNALGAMNYFIGYIMYYRDGKNDANKRKEALPYFYKSVQHNSFTKNTPGIYQAIGGFYFDEAVKMEAQRQEKIKAAEGKDTEESLALFALQKGYADRAIDAFARAYKIAKEDTKQKPEYVTSLYTRLKELFTFRFDGDTKGVDAYVAGVTSKPLADPATEVAPVKEVAPAPATTGTTPATTPAKPTSMNTTKSNDVMPETEARAATKPAAATKAVKAKKPAPKKKGTR